MTPRKIIDRLSSEWSERLAFLGALEPVNARAFLKMITAFKDGGVEFIFLFGNASALALLSGIFDRGPLNRLDWTLAWILRGIGALEASSPCFTVAIRSNAENLARFKSAWDGLGFDGVTRPAPPDLTWTFVVDAAYRGVLLETIWEKRRVVAEIEGYEFYQAPDMMGFSRS